MYNEVLFTHDDMDGAGCRIVFEVTHAKQPHEEWLVYNCTNQGISDDVNQALDEGVIGEDTIVFFADITPNSETLNNLVGKVADILIFDHHESAFWAEWVIGKDKAVIIPTNANGVMESGTSLLYKHYVDSSDVDDQLFNSSPTANFFTKLVDTIRSYDTYEWKKTGNQEAKNLMALFSLLGMENFCKRYREMITAGINDGDSLITENDMLFVQAKLDREQRIIDKFGTDRVIPLKLAGYRVAFTVNVDFVNVSELAYQFLTKFGDEFDVFISFSLSTGNFAIRALDVEGGPNTQEKIAVPLGGGGHPPASGARISDEVKDEIIQKITKYLEDRLS